MDQLREGGGPHAAGHVPIAIDFPAFGPSMFLEAELTAESQSPSLDIVLSQRREAADDPQLRHSTRRVVALIALVLRAGVACAQDAPRAAGPAGTVTLSRGDYDRLLDLGEAQPVRRRHARRCRGARRARTSASASRAPSRARRCAWTAKCFGAAWPRCR